MAGRLVHRGPDDGGAWSDPAAGVGLGHRRLAVIDLTEQGRQPMVSDDGRLVMVYNGEVYNFPELRRELEAFGASFRGHGDSEVVLAACRQWGVEEAVRRFVGMFAIAIWDCGVRRLTLVRDRLGIKPLYWGWVGQDLAFASQPSAIAAHPRFEPKVARAVVPMFLRLGYLPSPLCIYEGLQALEPGTVLQADEAGLARRKVRLERFWSVRSVVEQAVEERLELGAEEAADLLERHLAEAVRCRLVADVPVGAFLSGGVDSSLVVALMQAASSRRVRTFTIGFDVPGFDEAPRAAAVARHLGTDHTELYVDERQALEVIPRLAEIYDEPFADSSQIPTFLVSEMTRRHVTVALTGDGGDELHGGYERYPIVARDWRAVERLPRALRRLAAAGLDLASRPALGPLRQALVPLLAARGLATGSLEERLARRALLLGCRDLPGFVERHGHVALVPLAERWLHLPDGPGEPAGERILDEAWRLALDDPIETQMYIDLVQYLPDDILTKVDRASMAVSLETRVPMLDHRVVELTWRLPLALRTAGGAAGKGLLRQVLHRHVPAELVDRPKQGFAVPMSRWLRGHLRDWAEDLLAEHRLQESGLLQPAEVRRCWQEHLDGVYDHQGLLWPVLVLQAWQRRWRAG